MPPEIALFLGPVGATVLLLYIAKRLADAHDASDRDVIKQRDEAIAGWRETTRVNDRLADAIEVRNRDAEQRQRQGDGRRDR